MKHEELLNRGAEDDGTGASVQIDEEPTLENETPVIDDDPTLETEDQDMVPDDTYESGRRAGGWGARLEQMTAAKRQRRRQTVTRFWLATAPVLVLVVIAAVLLSVYGGRAAGDPELPTTGTVMQSAPQGAGVLLIARGPDLQWVVVLHPGEGGGTVLACPSVTLVEHENVFMTLGEVYKQGDAEAVRVSLADALALPLGPASAATAADIQTAWTTAGVAFDLAGASGLTKEGAESVAQAILTLIASAGPGEGETVWGEMELRGDAAGFLEAVDVDAASAAESVWKTGALWGSIVDGDGYYYLEPDIGSARALLTAAAVEADVTVEIKDGAGIDGAARRAGESVEGAGFALAPMGYADGYPDVAVTQVRASGGAMEDAQRISALLGAGEVTQDDTFAEGRIEVILGKDFDGGSSSVGGTG